jgi:ectoine hydroxylase-related dioxygenase (phytanoyl-CoA dioxygenase family)
MANNRLFTSLAVIGTSLLSYDYLTTQHDITPKELETSVQAILTSKHDLNHDGVMIVRNVLTEPEIKAWKAKVEKHCTASTAKSTSALGRKHLVLWRNEEDQPLVRLREDMELLGDSSSVLGKIALNFLPLGKLSQCQLLLALPGSTNQIWHRDNTEKGVTALIALTDIRQGPTELLVGTNKDGGVVIGGAESMLATIQAGDALIYDARTIHRGKGFESGPNRPTLVLRW